VTESLELQLDRFGELLRAVGVEPLLRAPLVAPNDDWFPDRWDADFESVREVLFRLVEYAGMPDLGVDAVFRTDPLVRNHLPEALNESFSAPGSGNRFLGFDGDWAWFSVDFKTLTSPRVLVTVMAHEVARAWRSQRGLPEKPSAEEAERVAVTAVFLGFGVLTCSAAYEHDAGPLSVEDVSGLLACWGQLRDAPPGEILKHLEPTQSRAFRRAWDELIEVDLWSRFGLPDERPLTPLPMERASDRPLPPGHASRAVHACAERVVELVGEDGGAVSTPVPLGAAPESVPYRFLAHWSRIGATGRWWRRLFLVSDPEWDTQLVVVEGQDGTVALGHIRDRDARNLRHLREFLVGVFRAAGPARAALMPALPTEVGGSGAPGSLGDSDLEAMFRAAVASTHPGQLARETAWLRRYSEQTMGRLEAERDAGGIPAAPSDEAVDYAQWWKVVSDPMHIRDEWAAWSWPDGEQEKRDSTVSGGTVPIAIPPPPGS